MIKHVYLSQIVALITISSVAQTILKPGTDFSRLPGLPRDGGDPVGQFHDG